MSTYHALPMKEAALRPSFRVCVGDGCEACGAGEEGCGAGCWGWGEESSSLIVRRVRGLAVLRAWWEYGFGCSARGFGGAGGGVKEGFEFVEVFWGGGL